MRGFGGKPRFLQHPFERRVAYAARPANALKKRRFSSPERLR